MLNIKPLSKQLNLCALSNVFGQGLQEPLLIVDIFSLTTQTDSMPSVDMGECSKTFPNMLLRKHSIIIFYLQFLTKMT
jgi:hypothetical protein